MTKIKRYSYEDAEEKSKKFLKDILGTELFEKFFKDGKIDVESGGNIYELYDSGRIINKTTNHTYCIVPTSPDFPVYDVIAIKYTWLKYGLKTVERVANKTSLTYSPRTDAEGRRIDGVGYDAFVHYMEQQGWRREQIRIDENDTNLVTTNSLSAECSGAIVDIRCPAGNMMTIMGTSQIPAGANPEMAYTLSLCVTGRDGKEISGNNKIRITKIKPTEEVIQLVRIFYADLSITRFRLDNERENIQKKTHNELYRWRQGIALYGEDHLTIDVINSYSYISSRNIKVNVDFDLWIKNMWQLIKIVIKGELMNEKLVFDSIKRCPSDKIIDFEIKRDVAGKLEYLQSRISYWEHRGKGNEFSKIK